MGEILKLLDTAKSYVGAKEGDSRYSELVRIFETSGYRYDGQGCCEVACSFFIKSLGLQRAGELIPIINYANAQSKRWKGGLKDSPALGSLVYFDYKDGLGIQHVELVIDYDDNVIRTIDGNSYHSVVRRERKRTYKYIAGYGHPEFKKDRDLVRMDFITAAINTIEIKKGQIGSMVLWLQKYLQSEGYYLEGYLDGVFGDVLLKAVKKWQADQPGLIADGVIGKYSLMRILM